MSKKKPSGVYLVPVINGEPVYVLARHPKGAAMAASLGLRGSGRLIGLTRDIVEVDASNKWRCLNLPGGRGAAEVA